MKKVLLLIAAFALLSTLSSCEDYEEKAINEYETQNINHDEVGNSDEEDDTDLDTAG